MRTMWSRERRPALTHAGALMPAAALTRRRASIPGRDSLALKMRGPLLPFSVPGQAASEKQDSSAVVCVCV